MKIKLFIVFSLAAFLVADKSKTEKTTTAPLRVEDSSPVPEAKERSSAHTNSRESSFASFKIDSSKNGYGGFLETTSPLAYSYDATGNNTPGYIWDPGERAGWVVVYRQFGTMDETAGFLGVAQSGPDGEIWTVDSRINTTYPESQNYTLANPGLPTPDGAPGARYPSAVVSSFQNKPMAVWNEYTLATYGGGESGGVPMFAYDYFHTGETSNFSGVQHLNKGCLNLNLAGGEVCDPPDLWQANVQLIDNDNLDGGPRLLAMYTSWADGTYPKYMIKSTNVANGYIIADDPNYFQQDSLDQDDQGNCVWYECGGYTGTPDFHVNRDGIGYLGMSSFSADSDTEPPFSHTIYFKQTEDYGATWTSEGGLKNSGYYYLSDDELYELHDSLLTLWSTNPDDYPNKPWYPWATNSEGEVVGDTIQFFEDTTSLGEQINYFNTAEYFVHYEYDIMTDQDGGLHFTAMSWPYLCEDIEGGCADYIFDGSSEVTSSDSIALYNIFAGAGMYHYYNPNPVERPNDWTATFIEDYSETFYADWPAIGPMTLYSDPEYFFTPNVRPSYEEGSQVLWYASVNMSSAEYNADSTLEVPTDLDIFMSKSVDNGRTWTEAENVTNTLGIEGFPQVEYGHHLANIGSDYEIGIFYQMPNFDFETYPPATGYYDYMNYVYVGKYQNDLESLSTIGGENKKIIPSAFVLKQNYPNPFNPISKISFGIDADSNVKLSLYDVRGGFVETLINKKTQAGNHDFMLDASHLSSGVYFYTMTVDDVSQTKKLVLMK
jgi:hypothetical protein